MIDSNCEGCPYHVYPYTAQSPVMENGKYITKEFRSDEDVWVIIDSIIKETNTVNKEQKKNFGVAESVSSQIPFFACINRVLNQKCKMILHDIYIVINLKCQHIKVLMETNHIDGLKKALFLETL